MPADVQIQFKAESQQARREIAQLKREVQELRQQLGQTQRTSTEAAVGVDTLGDKARAAARDVEGLTDQLTKTREAAQSAKTLADTIITAEQAFNALTPTLQQSALAVGGSSGLTGLMRSAAAEAVGLRGEIEALEEPFTQFNISLADASKEQQRLTQFSRELIHELNVLERHSRPFEVLHADINLVNPAISDAAENMRLYIRVMDDVQDEFQEIDTLSERLTTSIRNQASAFDELRDSVGGVSAAASGLQGQQLGSGVFDRFDARTPGSNFGASFGDNIAPVAAQLGQELASQAIRTAGELRRIERDRIEDLQDLEREYSEQIVAINERKRERLAAVEQQIEDERIRRIASIEAAFQTAADTEVEARAAAAERIQQIEERAAEARQQLRERLNDRLIALEQRRDDRIQDLTDGLIEREQERQQRILEITENAAEARAAAEARYADRVQDINNRLVERIRAIQRGLQEEIESLESGFIGRQEARAAEIVRITQDAAAARAAANQTFTDTMQGIYNTLVEAWDDLEEGFTERQADRAQERVAIEQQAADARVAANEDYADSVARISTDLVDEVRRIEAEIVDVQERHARDRLAIEQESIESRAEANAAYTRRLAEIETERERELEDSNRRLAAIQQEAADARLEADRDYADRFQDIQNDLVERVVGIQRNLNDTLNDLRDDSLDAEQDRLDSLVALHEDTQQRLEDLARNRSRTVEDLREGFQRNQLDAATQLDRDLREAEDDPEQETAARERYQRRIQDLTRSFHRDVLDLQKRQARAREDLARQAAAKEVEIAERAQARQAEIAQQQTDARAQAREGITAAESAAGVAFQEAQANYVPALSAHEQALSEHTAALNRINAETAISTEAIEQSRTEALQTGINAAAAAAQTLSDALSAVTAAEQERLSALRTETTGSLSGLNQQITDAEARTGLSFEAALANYTPAVDLNTQALQALTEALNAAETERTESLGAVDAAGLLDRGTTQTAQQALETGAGVSIEDARTNYVPALSGATQATLTLNATMRELESSFREAIAEIQDAGLVDRQATDAALQEAVANAIAQQTALETQAGTTFADASLAFQPGISDIAQAGIDRDTALSDIDRTEGAEIDAVNAQSIADRLETDAAITEARDVYIKARDTEIFKHNAAILQLNLAEAADIKGVRATLDKNLGAIDEKLDLELAEIREAKIVFDTRIGELINAINAEANQDVSALKADTAAMRSSLEAIAEEARNNAWKSALLKVANVGITVAGVAAGTALGNPVAGLAVGQAVGGLVEQGGNELLFHYARTDAIANRLARQAALRRSRPAPDYLPTPTQLRNAEDLGREVISGFLDGVNQRSRSDGGFGGASQQTGLPEEVTATIQISFSDGGVIELSDQILRLRGQDRVNI